MAEIIPGIYKAYDNRGLYPAVNNELYANWIGGANYCTLKANRIAARSTAVRSSPHLADAP